MYLLNPSLSNKLMPKILSRHLFWSPLYPKHLTVKSTPAITQEGFPGTRLSMVMLQLTSQLFRSTCLPIYQALVTLGIRVTRTLPSALASSLPDPLPLGERTTPGMRTSQTLHQLPVFRDPLPVSTLIAMQWTASSKVALSWHLRLSQDLMQLPRLNLG